MNLVFAYELGTTVYSFNKSILLATNVLGQHLSLKIVAIDFFSSKNRFGVFQKCCLKEYNNGLYMQQI